MYSTYILVHPRTQQLQNVLTLEDYQQIQALLEYVLKRQQQQQQQQGYLQHVGEQSREYLRLCQALYNNKLLSLDYRRQRAAQLQRLLQRHHDRFHNCDRARLLAALEKHRAQQAFRRFIETYYQQNDGSSYNDNEMEQEPIQQKLETRQEPVQFKSETQQESTNTVEQQEEEEEQKEQQQQQEDEEEEEEPIDNAYEQYQTQQLEDLLKHIFEKNSTGQHSGAINDDEDEEYAYAPVQDKQYPQDEQTMADLLPLLDEKNDNIRDRYVDPMPTKAVSPPATPSKAPEQPMESDDDESSLPDNVLPLQNVLDELIRTPTPAVQSPTRKDPPPPKAPAPTTSTRKNPPPPKAPAARDDPPLFKAAAAPAPAPAPQPTKDPIPPPVPPKSTSSDCSEPEHHHHTDRHRKLEQLSAIERKLDELSNENKNDNITRLPLQHQVNDQGRLFLDGNTPDNRKFLTYEDEIIRCMIQLDQILSDGDHLVRDRRREAVRKAEALLEPVDRHKQDEWAKAQHIGKKKPRHRHNNKRKVRIPVTA